MAKELSEMSLEELWELFPIFLVEHNDKWNKNYKEIELFLKKVLSRCPVERISHIGSTAVEGIWAKDIVDVLIEVSRDSDIERTAKVMEENGFIKYKRGDCEKPEYCQESSLFSQCNEIILCSQGQRVVCAAKRKSYLCLAFRETF